MLRTFFTAAALALIVTAAAAETPLTYALDVSNGSLRGPGAKVLEDAAQNAQFILFGEDHGFADSPILVRALARDVRKDGFDHLFVEVGPRSTRLVRDTLRESGVAGVARIVHATPLALPFLGNKEDAELASDFTGTDAQGLAALSGVDQEFFGSPMLLLPRLVALAPDAKAKALAQHMLDTETAAATAAAWKSFLLTTASDADFDALSAAYGTNPDAQSIIGEMKESAAIYQLYMANHNYENNARRARLMARNFLAAYRPGGKYIFKMGIEHVALGTTTNNTMDLGTLASMTARANGHGALRIAFLPAGGHVLSFTPKPGNPTAVQAYDPGDWGVVFKNIGLDTATLPKTGWTLIPLEPVRQSLDTKGILALSSEARFLVLGFDYLITTPDAKPATFLY